MNESAIKALKAKFHLADKTGTKTLKKSWAILKKRPAEAALFTMLAANIINRRGGKATKQV